MLVLSRKPQERICIGPDVTLTILRLERGRVKIGIEAPDSIRVTRPEAHGVPEVGDHGPNFQGIGSAVEDTE